MVLTIDLPADVGRRLEEAAAHRGQEPAEYVGAIVTESLLRDEWRSQMAALFSRSHANAAASGSSWEEIEAEIRGECEQVRKEHFDLGQKRKWEQELRQGAS